MDFSLGAYSLDFVGFFLKQRYAAGVIASVFQAFKPLQQEVGDIALCYSSDDTTHDSCSG